MWSCSLSDKKAEIAFLPMRNERNDDKETEIRQL